MINIKEYSPAQKYIYSKKSIIQEINEKIKKYEYLDKNETNIAQKMFYSDLIIEFRSLLSQYQKEA